MLFLESPNMTSETGLDRNKLVLNPLAGSKGHPVTLDHCRCFGQLLGITLRSDNVLDLDVVDVFWKLLVQSPVESTDLANFDYVAYNNLRFLHPVEERRLLDEEEFQEIYGGELTWSVTCSGGSKYHLRGSLQANGTVTPDKVLFTERWNYAREATLARIHESRLALGAITEGLHSIVPPAALRLLSWQEVQSRVCGQAALDLERLKAKTVYAPKPYSQESSLICWFWAALHAFSETHRAQFLQFAWARRRLPSSSSSDDHWRMKVEFVRPLYIVPHPLWPFVSRLGYADDFSVLLSALRISCACSFPFCFSICALPMLPSLLSLTWARRDLMSFIPTQLYSS